MSVATMQQAGGGSAISRYLAPLVRRRAELDAFFRKHFRRDSLATWFFRALHTQHSVALRAANVGWRPPHGGYYEFGVGRGRSMLRFIKALKLHCALEGIDPYSYFLAGFDSFEGLPPKQSARDDHPGWWEGRFSCPLEHITRVVGSQMDLGRGNVRFIKGRFEDTLTPELAAELSAHPPSIVTIDVDYYSSTRTALDWLARMLPSGCLFYFDDLWAFSGHPEMGELGAINEFNRGDSGYLTPYSELGSTVGGRTYIFARKIYEYGKER